MAATRYPYSRNQYILPNQDGDIFDPVYFQPSEAVPLELGSSAGGQAVLNSYAFSNPGYSESTFDRYAKQPAAGAAPYLDYEKELELNNQTEGYYQSVNHLNDLAVKARQLGFNIKQPDFRDPNQVAFYNEYQNNLAKTQALAEDLKQRRQNFKTAAPDILSGKVIAPEYGQGWTAQDLAAMQQTTAAETQAYNDALRNTNSRPEFAKASEYEQTLRQHFQDVLNDPNADDYSKKVAQRQLDQMDVTTFDNNSELDRAERERRAREARAASQTSKIGAEGIIAKLNGLLTGQGFQETGGRFVNTDLRGVQLLGKTVADVERGAKGQNIIHFQDGTQSALDQNSFFTVAQALANKNGIKPEDVMLHANERGLVGSGGEFLPQQLNTPERLAQTDAYNRAMHEVNKYQTDYAAHFAEKNFPVTPTGTANVVFTNPITLFPGTSKTGKVSIKQGTPTKDGSTRYTVYNEEGKVQQIRDESGTLRPAENLYRDEVLKYVAQPVAAKLATSQPAYQRARELNQQMGQQPTSVADLDFNRTNSSRQSSSGPAATTAPQTLSGQVDPASLKVGAVYLVNGKQYTYNGSKLVPFN